MKIELCDICERRLGVDDINVQYKVRATKHAFDGWSSIFYHSVDICDRCVKIISKLANQDAVTTAASPDPEASTEPE